MTIATTANTKATPLEAALANARYCAFQLGDLAAAEQHYQNALAINANNFEALVGIGQLLCRRHQRKKGKSFLEKAAKLLLRRADKAEPSMLLDLAEQLRQWGSIETALQLYRATLKRSPQSVPAQLGLASCLHRLNQTNLALQLLSKGSQSHRNDAAYQLQLAILEIEQKQHATAKKRLQDIIDNESNESRYRARAHLELARIYDKTGEYDHVFPALENAAQLNQKQLEHSAFDKNEIFKKIEQFKVGFDNELLLRWNAEQLAEGLPIPVFLMGFLRSGTTLVEQALSAHPDILTSDENTLINELSNELTRLSGIHGDTPSALNAINLEQAKKLRQFYWQRVEEEYAAATLKHVFINKTALNSIEIGLISCLFPEAKIIFALRDPRDVCLSCAMQAFTPSPATVNLMTWQGIAREYAAVMNLWLHLRKRIAPEYYELRYEDTITQFETSLGQILHLIGLSWHPNVARFHDNAARKYIATPSFADVSKPIYRDALERWKHYQDQFSTVAPFLKPIIKALDY